MQAPKSRSPSASPPMSSGSPRGDGRGAPPSQPPKSRPDPSVRSEQAKDWAAKRAEAIAKAAKLRAERENNAFGTVHGDFLDRLSAAEMRDQQQGQGQQQGQQQQPGPSTKVRRKSPIRSAGKRLKKIISSGAGPTSPLKKKRSLTSAADKAAQAKAAADKAAREQRRREAKPSAADPARELALHGYEALGPIAAGSFSTILRARRAGVDNAADVAVKTFDNAKCAKSRELGDSRDRELEALRLLAAAAAQEAGARHPHIAYLLAEHEGPNTSHAVLEYCPGGSLQRHMQLLQKQKAPARGASAHSVAGSSGEGVGMPEEQVARLTSQVASALAHMHALDLAHRDVKPGNILFDNEGGAAAADFRIKLCDFGFATKCGGRMLRKLVGTPSYIAPELTGAGTEAGYRGRPVDLWALGVVVFEILHGKPAFYGANLEQLETRIRAVSHAPFDAPVSAGARALVQALLKAEPAKRLTAKKALEHSWLKQHALAHTVTVAPVHAMERV